MIIIIHRQLFSVSVRLLFQSISDGPGFAPLDDNAAADDDDDDNDGGDDCDEMDEDTLVVVVVVDMCLAMFCGLSESHGERISRGWWTPLQHPYSPR